MLISGATSSTYTLVAADEGKTIKVKVSLDGVLSRFAERRLDEAYPYLVLDAHYEKVRLDGASGVDGGFVTRPRIARPVQAGTRGGTT